MFTVPADAGNGGRILQMRLRRTLADFVSAVLQIRRLRPYLDILAVGSGARIFGLASQFVVLILLSRFLSKESFGNLMTAFGFYRLAGLYHFFDLAMLMLFAQRGGRLLQDKEFIGLRV